MKDGDKFRCAKCSREQSYQPIDQPGGVTREEAEWLGWQLSPITLCPFCTGRTSNLAVAFEKGAQLDADRRHFWTGLFVGLTLGVVLTCLLFVAATVATTP